MFQIPSQTQVKVLPGCYEKSNLAPRLPAVPILDFSQSMCAHAPELPHVWSRMVAALSRRTTERLQIELDVCVFDTHVLLQDYAALAVLSREAVELFRWRHHVARRSPADRHRRHTPPTTVAGRRRDPLSSSHLSRRDGRICHGPSDPGRRLREMHVSERKREMQFVFLAPDQDCMPQLRTVFHCDPISLDEISFEQLFDALTRSLSTYSCSQIGYEPEPRRLLLEQLRPHDTQAE